jgi:hypothetical protein
LVLHELRVRVADCSRGRGARGGLIDAAYSIRASMNTTPQRELWNGNAVHLGDVWTLRKRNHVVQCMLFTDQFGWQLRLKVGEVFRTHVCRSIDEILKTQAA